MVPVNTISRGLLAIAFAPVVVEKMKLLLSRVRLLLVDGVMLAVPLWEYVEVIAAPVAVVLLVCAELKVELGAAMSA
jgi:hypothetical protein